MNYERINDIFNKFAGREVFGPFNPVAMPDPVIEEIREEAAKHGFDAIRVNYPDHMMFVTTDYNEKRLNVTAVKGDDGKYRIGKNFGCG